MTIVLLPILFVAAGLAGYYVIRDVPSLLHTPLMSGMNALSGITALAAVTATALSVFWGSGLLGALAVIFAMINVVGGFVVTGRMLKMFKSRQNIQ